MNKMHVYQLFFLLIMLSHAMFMSVGMYVCVCVRACVYVRICMFVLCISLRGSLESDIRYDKISTNHPCETI